MNDPRQRKVYKKGKEAHDAIIRGVLQVSDVVGSTLGPMGRNVIIDQMLQAPKITNDGVSIAMQMVIDDEIEQLGAQTLIEAAYKTNIMVGDGTTTSVVIASRLIDDGFKLIDSHEGEVGGAFNANTLKTQINALCAKVVEDIKKKSKQVKTLKDLEKVAITSVENEELGKKIAEVAWKVGKDGFIVVEENFGFETEIEVIDGLHLPAKYLDERFAGNAKKEAVYEQAPILVTNMVIDDIKPIQALANDLLTNEKQNGLVILAPDFDKSTHSTLILNHVKNIFHFLPIKTSAMNDKWLEDVAIWVGAKIIDKDKRMLLSDIRKEHLGKARKVITNQRETAILGGAGDKEKIKNRIEFIKEQVDIEKVENLKNQLKRRISCLSGGLGMIKVSANTVAESTYIRDKIEDAKNATLAALDEGVIPGGGVALKEIAEKYKNTPIYNALKAPYEKIQENAGMKFDISPDILDPAKVTRVALENACSIAGVLLTTNAVIAMKRTDALEDLKKFLWNKE